MEKSRRFSALVMALVMLFTFAASFTANAQSVSEVIWNEYYAASTQQIEAAVMLTPGSNESERYVSWYSKADKGEVVLLDALGSEIGKFSTTAKPHRRAITASAQLSAASKVRQPTHTTANRVTGRAKHTLLRLTQTNHSPQCI